MPPFDEFVDKQREAGNETFANAFTFEEERRARRRSEPEPEPEPSPSRSLNPEPEPSRKRRRRRTASYGDDFAGESGEAALEPRRRG